MGRQSLLLVVGIALVFCVVVAILLKLMPGPHRPADYLVIGAIATLVSMLLLFLVLINTNLKSGEVFSKRGKNAGGQS